MQAVQAVQAVLDSLDSLDYLFIVRGKDIKTALEKAGAEAKQGKLQTSSARDHKTITCGFFATVITCHRQFWR